jgi:hypothetical protein
MRTFPTGFDIDEVIILSLPVFLLHAVDPRALPSSSRRRCVRQFSLAVEIPHPHAQNLPCNPRAQTKRSGPKERESVSPEKDSKLKVRDAD